MSLLLAYPGAVCPHEDGVKTEFIIPLITGRVVTSAPGKPNSQGLTVPQPVSFLGSGDLLCGLTSARSLLPKDVNEEK